MAIQSINRNMASMYRSSYTMASVPDLTVSTQTSDPSTQPANQNTKKPKPDRSKDTWWKWVGGTLLVGFVALSHYGYRIDRQNFREIARIHAERLESKDIKKDSKELFKVHWKEARIGYTWERIKHIISLWPKLAINKLAGEPMIPTYELKPHPEKEGHMIMSYGYEKQTVI